ncbi:MAG: type II secretion system F family protein [Erythrobacter sp.]
MFGPNEIRFLSLLAIFGAVFLVTQLVLSATAERRSYMGAVNKRLKLMAQGKSRDDVVGVLRKNDPLAGGDATGLFGKSYFTLRRNLAMAAVGWTVGQVLAAIGVLFAVLAISASMLAVQANYQLGAGALILILSFAAAGAIGLPLTIVSWLAQKRRKKMEAQFPIAIDLFVRSLRSGHPISGALYLVSQEMVDPIGSEFGVVTDEVAYGSDLTEALSDMAERWDLDDIRMFVTSLSVQNQTGGNLAEILDNLANVIRERASLFLKVRALSSEGRMTGIMLTALPVLTFVGVFTLNPEFYFDVAGDPIFFIGFPLMILWYFFGVFLIRRMVNIKV